MKEKYTRAKGKLTKAEHGAFILIKLNGEVKGRQGFSSRDF
jgi:hypothetical protein